MLRIPRPLPAVALTVVAGLALAGCGDATVVEQRLAARAAAAATDPFTGLDPAQIWDVAHDAAGLTRSVQVKALLAGEAEGSSVGVDLHVGKNLAAGTLTILDEPIEVLRSGSSLWYFAERSFYLKQKDVARADVDRWAGHWVHVEVPSGDASAPADRGLMYRLTDLHEYTDRLLQAPDPARYAGPGPDLDGTPTVAVSDEMPLGSTGSRLGTLVVSTDGRNLPVRRTVGAKSYVEWSGWNTPVAFEPPDPSLVVELVPPEAGVDAGGGPQLPPPASTLFG